MVFSIKRARLPAQISVNHLLSLNSPVKWELKSSCQFPFPAELILSTSITDTILVNLLPPLKIFATPRLATPLKNATPPSQKMLPRGSILAKKGPK